MCDIGIFIFRRDHRIIDNHGLVALSEKARTIFPVFILDDTQIVLGKHNAAYFSNNAVQFMCESLVDLDKQIRASHSLSHSSLSHSSLSHGLRLYYGKPHIILGKLLDELSQSQITTCVGWNSDYSAYSILRDNALKHECELRNVAVIECTTDYTLRPMEENRSLSDTGYKQFGAFYKRASRLPPTRPLIEPIMSFSTISFSAESNDQFNINELGRFYAHNPHIAQNGGRTLALEALAKSIEANGEYDTMRDRLSYTTTNISASLNFGCISIREAYYSFINVSTSLVKQLYWRDFYLQVMRYIPGATSFTHYIDSRYDNIPWTSNKREWTQLMNAQTGFLLVDASMNQMKASGYIHGRGRMLLSVFWTKYLLISILDPKYGSQVGFSKWLVDAIGPSQNKLNHHWVCDLDYPGKKYSAPGAPLSGRPMDVSNKMIAKWDPTGAYIKRWIPELVNVPVRDLRKWDSEIAALHNNIHPAPMFDAKTRYAAWITACKQATA